jgi:hypothetical protein
MAETLSLMEGCQRTMPLGNETSGRRRDCQIIGAGYHQNGASDDSVVNLCGLVLIENPEE